MKDILTAEYSDLDNTALAGKCVVTYLDGTTETFTSAEDMKVVQAKLVEQMQAIL